MSVSIEQVRAAAARIESRVHRTPLLTSRLINARAGCRIAFKCENLQRAGAFKARGAFNAVMSLAKSQRDAGVATHSSGNHAAALALAARELGTRAHIVMPSSAAAVKVAAVESYGGDITFCEPTQAAREASLEALCARTGAHFVPPYDHPDIVAGQGTCALEIYGQAAEPPDVLIAPVGGGGLLAGSAIASRAVLPAVQIIGAEPAGADDAQRSFHSGVRQQALAPDTIADGLRSSIGALNFAIITALVDDILTVTDAQIIEAMRLVWTRMKLLVEPSAAVPLAVVMANPQIFAGKSVAIVLSGGNVDIDALPW